MAWMESVDTLLANKGFGELSFSHPNYLQVSHFHALISADGLDAFRAFLKSEFSEENIEFWLACEDFKKTKSAAKIVSKAQKIYSEFIQADAPKEVTHLYIFSQSG
ncbi:hypothetical protein JD844_017401 [Phrynosoma platyrhinos]|uniref:RGS domain-containing protein n=1 Tax=Phrynosoma platyrhinos TaxID=52577 RepID=A0ABQ7SLT1_PHRPL|nr:hypothetical protein JD844_017401 [Phrynosoma platyrhinos]